MSVSVDPEERAAAQRARAHAQAALVRARRIVARSRLLLWSQSANRRSADPDEEGGGEE